MFTTKTRLYYNHYGRVRVKVWKLFGLVVWSKELEKII